MQISKKDTPLILIKDRIFEGNPFTRYELIDEALAKCTQSKDCVAHTIRREVKEGGRLFCWCKLKIGRDVLYFLPKHKDKIVETYKDIKRIEAEIKRIKHQQKKITMRGYNEKTL